MLTRQSWLAEVHHQHPHPLISVGGLLPNKEIVSPLFLGPGFVEESGTKLKERRLHSSTVDLADVLNQDHDLHADLSIAFCFCSSSLPSIKFSTSKFTLPRARARKRILYTFILWLLSGCDRWAFYFKHCKYLLSTIFPNYQTSRLSFHNYLSKEMLKG